MQGDIFKVGDEVTINHVWYNDGLLSRLLPDEKDVTFNNEAMFFTGKRVVKKVTNESEDEENEGNVIIRLSGQSMLGREDLYHYTYTTSFLCKVYPDE